MEWLRFKIAKYISGRYSDICWFNLVFWALGWRSLRETFGCEGNWKSQTCRWDNPDTPYAYCGKCRMNGRYFLGHPEPVETLTD